MFKRLQLARFCLLTLLVPSALAAAQLGVGSTRDEVVGQLGDPKSKMKAGGREILGYPNGRVTLADERVVRIDWKGAMPATPSAPAQSSAPSAPAVPAARTAAPAPARPVLRDGWMTDYAAAQAEAAASHRRLLVLFTGSDWCPACIEFEASVAHAEDFMNATRAAFVLVKLDFPRTTPQPAEVRARNEKLFRRYGVDSYPTLLVLSADGAKSQRVDTSHPRPASDIVDFFVQAVDEARRAKG